MTTNKNVATMYRTAERYDGNLHFKNYFRQVLRLNPDIPYENAEHNVVYIYENGELTKKRYGDLENRNTLYRLIMDKMDDVTEPIVHDAMFYAVYESEEYDKVVEITDLEYHTSLIESIIDASTKEKEHGLVMYFTQVDETGDKYAVRSVCVESAIQDNEW